MAKFLTRIFGSRNQRLLRQYSKVVAKINALEDGLQELEDADLRAKTDELRQRYAGGETLEQLLPEAFAADPDRLFEVPDSFGLGKREGAKKEQ